MGRLKLSTLTYEDFEITNAWKVMMETINEDDVSLEPALVNSNGYISKKNEEVWCLCLAIFSNGLKYKATGMCRGDSSEGPLLWSIWNGLKDIPLILPPAPPFILKFDGPESFSKEFGLDISKVFPIEFNVIPHFETKPSKRIVILDTDGAK